MHYLKIGGLIKGIEKMNTVAGSNQFVIAKFGGTSVANFDAMNKSADIVLANNHVRVVVLSASAGDHQFAH